MKTISILMLFLLSFGQTVQAQDNAIQKYFQKYAEDDDFTAVYISEHMFSLFANVEMEGTEDEAINSILANLKELHVLTTEKSGNEYYKEAVSKINTSEYKSLMSVRDGGENVRFFAKKDDRKITELLLLVGSEEEFVLLSLVGEIELSKISQLSKHMQIKGMDHLDKIEKKD
ncbi:MAG: DUF4252 domain-containing protein [Aureispira sp.]|nr:DUF4252 domain-containing protein [Aureispira sp.]